MFCHVGGLTSLLFSEEDRTVEYEPGAREGRVSVRHREPGGIGYDQGYTSLDLFYAWDLKQTLCSFIDLRGHIFNNGKWASNAGFGLRGKPNCREVVWGGNVYWDWRESNHASFDQLSAGLEALWVSWDLRINGYLPFHRERRNAIAMGGIDMTLGKWLWRSGTFGIHGALGGYYFKGDSNKQAGGGRVNADLHLTDWVTLKAQVSYDNLFKWNAQGEVALNIPFGKGIGRDSHKTNCAPFVTLERRLIGQPERFEIIVTTTHKK